jgi:hypothetical protein
VQRERAAYESGLAKRFRLLSDAAAQYDAGNEDHVTNMAIHLRSLLTERLIDKVTPLDQLCFTDTADRLPEGPVAGYGFGLTRIRADAGWEDGSVGGGQVVAPLGGAFEEHPPPTVPFPDWWSQAVIYPTNRPFLTREYVVYEMANTDAVHVDPVLDEDYEALTRDNHGFKINDLEVTGNLAHATIRQITWETQHTLHRSFPALCQSGFPSKPAFLPGHCHLRVLAQGQAASAEASAAVEESPFE